MHSSASSAQQQQQALDFALKLLVSSMHQENNKLIHFFEYQVK
jgi:hypothetical protein